MSLPSCRSVFDCFVLEVFRPKVQFRTTLQLSSIVMVLVGGHLGGTAISHCSQMAAIATREVRTGIFRTLKPLLDPRLPLQGPDPCTPPLARMHLCLALQQQAAVPSAPPLAPARPSAQPQATTPPGQRNTSSSSGTRALLVILHGKRVEDELVRNALQELKQAGHKVSE